MECKDDWERAEYEYIQCLNRYEVAEAKLEDARRVLLELTPEEGRNGELLKVQCQKNRGAVDWRAALYAVLDADEIALHDIGDKFRKPESSSWYVRMNKLPGNL